MKLLGIFLQAQPAGNSSFTLIFMGLMILVFWMFMIRPQAKIAGIHGTINKVNEDGTISLEVNPGSYLKIEKSTISMEMSAGLNKAVAETK